jgi:potassium/hydrogen antiporter
LLSKIQQPVKFVPIILMIVLIYAVSKMYHLPALIFILLFGLFMGNLDELKHIAFIQKLQPNILNKEVHRFKDLTTEIVFLVRALFFLLFGFLIETSELLNSSTIIWAVSITGSIFLLRWVCLKLFKLPVKPLLFIAPRGLITILLFLSIPISQSNSIANKSLIIQVIILSALVMMFGLIASKASVKQSELSASE